MSLLHEDEGGVGRTAGSQLPGGSGGGGIDPRVIEVVVLLPLLPFFLIMWIVRRIRKNSPAAKRRAADEAERRMHGEHQRGARLTRADELTKMINQKRGK